MRTGRSLTVCCSLLPGRGGLPGPWGGVCLVLGGVSAWSRGGGSPCQGGLPRDPPPVNRITHTCKNITLATTLLRPVIINILGYGSSIPTNYVKTWYIVLEFLNCIYDWISLHSLAQIMENLRISLYGPIERLNTHYAQLYAWGEISNTQFHSFAWVTYCWLKAVWCFELMVFKTI